MAVVLVLIILVLGYRYTNAVPAEKIALKRNDGWVAYVRMASHGLRFVSTAIFIYVTLAVCTIIMMFFIMMMYRWLDISAHKYKEYLNHITILWSLKYYDIGMSECVIAWFAFASCSRSIKAENGKNKSSQRREIRKQDAILDIIIDAAEQLHPVKVSLKSRKFYIGIIQAEQFEHPDSDNITIIPYYSGHRDKDTLKIVFDSNYIEVYEKRYGKNFLDILARSHSSNGMRNLEEFRIVIRVAEIESISFFDLNYYHDDFVEKPKKFWKLITQQE